ncbi:hypothetical protein K432DRAFT_288739, partial [Lepidopterella palustris CBS 459.81]
RCTPVSPSLVTNGNFMLSEIIISFSYALNAMSIVSDWTLIIIRIFVLTASKLNSCAKLIVLFLLGLGIFASVTSIIRSTSILALQSSLGYTYTAIPIALWTIAENGLCIWPANLTPYHPLFHSLVDV